MINITNTAQDYLYQLLSTKKKGTQIRIFITNQGTPKAECGIAYYLPNALDINYIKIDFQKISVYIDKISAPYLQDVKIDFITNELNSQLTIKAPYAKIINIDNNAPLSQRIEYVLQSKINPQLSTHGGQVKLIEVTEDGIAILKFGGGCNGCSMVQYTLKEGIEKELLYIFPELQGVRDLTEHKRSKQSYY
ncbi:Fe/S biogenesis protein NfuA [Candidatus Profftia lariciata]|uniref:Fe-S biogenesis protein NfuA n=1 Tax=Candidatus Profftia lariciata TaxID=1987921 RepID=UPI001D010453|nr:Fe-S biogenesis protein NfuA [Candidatus Profftia lariciata]UDG81478.1 Fe/S biogenesis protein NfuA [Candidatus Profftia lariciata]